MQALLASRGTTQWLPMHVAFLNENTLGHGSYLKPLVDGLNAQPRHGISATMLNVTPLPPLLAALGDTTIRVLRRYNADFNAARWRWAASRNATRVLSEYRGAHPTDAVFANTQSIALGLRSLARELPLFVSVDATFRQLARDGWFGRGALARWLHPITLLNLVRRETELYAAARGIVAFSERVRRSLRDEYGVPDERICVIPTSMAVPTVVPPQPRNARPRLLFIGGDFKRKRGQLLLDAYAGGLRDRCDLHVVTQMPLSASAGLYVYHGIRWGTPEWRALWESADLFIFPSNMDTFGNVLVEALAFGVPVISARVGASEEILDDGAAGVLLADLDEQSLARAIHDALDDLPSRQAYAAAGRIRAQERYDISRNVDRLAGLLNACAVG